MLVLRCGMAVVVWYPYAGWSTQCDTFHVLNFFFRIHSVTFLTCSWYCCCTEFSQSYWFSFHSLIFSFNVNVLIVFINWYCFSSVTWVSQKVTIFYFEPLLLLLLLLLLLYDMDVSCHRPFLPGTSLEPAVIPTAQASSFTCSTFRIMCDVPSIAVFCSESIEWFPSTVSKFFLKLLVTVPVVPIITGIIVQFRFHTRCISIHKLLYFNFF